ncbi:MAG: DUF4251 domain-containing protein, partial [Bacteroidota bacterium]
MNIFLKYRPILLLFILVGCASQQKNTVTAEEIEKLDKLISEKSFEIKARWAKPLVTNSLNRIANAGLLAWGSTSNQIDVSSSNSFVRILGDSVITDLPYFGEQQIPGKYNDSHVGIQYEGIPEDFKITKNENDKYYEIDFVIKNDIETYDLNIKIYPNLSSYINVVSSHRTTVAYNGRIRFSQKEKHNKKKT